MRQVILALGAVSAVLGVLLIGAGIAWPILGGGPSDADKRIALEFLAASREMESSSPSAGGAGTTQAARERYQTAREGVELAKSAGKRTSFWLKSSGALLALIGVGGLLADRNRA
ncbi:hypothetical protein Pla175_26070 [Pirellulimonas nuda]|uniref:Uncharacterized protein n=1 Tax=Pirellulimonas nuda TaxID=2528009 RepID=A0A518DCN1_9BACT|nr:hypothetical protein [Pirellulimonas nuda]QDU89220.1 hypothetical protein Pla175_26070 [Pirellulimonas nuda]